MHASRGEQALVSRAILSPEPRPPDRKTPLRWRAQFLGLLLACGLAGNARGQFRASGAPRSGVVGTVRDLAPEPIAEAAQPAPAESGVPPLVNQPSADDAEIAAYRNDAAINDIALADLQHGWAVGDAGTIWHTADGGQHWQLQRSGVGCRLQSVQFIDANTGWAAGGTTAPYTHLTSGVLLRTRDGGEHWTTVDRLLLPALRRIQFISPTRGYAIGQSSAMFPCGLFFTDDGGRQWSPLPIAEAADCRTGDFDSIGQGAVGIVSGLTAGGVAGGGVAIVRDGRMRPAICPQLGLASIRQVRLAGPDAGWLVGDGGLVLASSDGGASWHAPQWRAATDGDTATIGETVAGELTSQFRRQFDFAALAVRGPNVWIAGSPGNCVFHSPDGGRTWIVGRTEQRVPISALVMVDDLHGWCAGALGTIEATDDGGRTWHLQRSGGERVALLGVFSEAGDVPLELFARTSAADGYLSVVDLVNRRDVETPSRDAASVDDRFQEALSTLGAERAQCAWQFPLRQPGIDLSMAAIKIVWDQATDGDGMAALDAHLVRQIRMWRPSVVLTTDPGDERSGDERQVDERQVDERQVDERHAAVRLVREAIKQAVRHAADPASGSRLPPWSVPRLFAVLPRGQTGPTSVDTSQLSPRLGRSLAELCWEPRGLIADRYAAAPEAIELRALENPLGIDVGEGDFFSGLGLRPGGEARRELPQPTLEAVSALRRSAIERRNAQAILSRDRATSDSDRLAQISDLTAAMDSRAAGELLYRLGQSYARAGKWELAEQVFELLVGQYPQHPLTPPAEIWLLQAYASSIAEHETAREAGGDAMPQAAANTVPGVNSAAFNAPIRPPAGDRPQRAIQLAGRIETSAPALFAEPSVRLAMAAAYRRLGKLSEADHALLAMRSGPNDAWSSCAAAESWLEQQRGPAPKNVWHCATFGAPPRLDGALADPMWQNAEAVALHSALKDDKDWPASARLACDEQFLYLAIQCRKAPGIEYLPAKTPRPKQADLSAHDRIDLLLSPDRDYTSYYRLSIDHRGWVNSGCWNDAPWQPACFVAAAERDGNWSIAAAIPWQSLVGETPVGRRSVLRGAWGVNIQRTVPSLGFQSWSTPAAATIRPEGMGLLLFQPAASMRIGHPTAATSAR